MRIIDCIKRKLNGPKEIHKALREQAESVIEITGTVKLKRERLLSLERDFPITGFLMNIPPRRGKTKA